MKISRAVTTRYARALLEMNDEKCLKVVEVLARLKDDKVKSFLKDPTISPMRKANVLLQTLNLSEKCERMLEIIFEHKRFDIFRDLSEIATNLWLRKHGKERVVVRSAQELKDDEKNEIINIVKKLRKTDPIIEIVKDDALLAGVVIDFEDAVVDMSAAGALKRAATLMGG